MKMLVKDFGALLFSGENTEILPNISHFRVESISLSSDVSVFASFSEKSE